MSVNAFTEEYEYIELFGKPGLFTNARIDRDTVPEGWYAYDLRGSDYDPGEPVTVEPSVVVNHAGTILTHEPISFPKEGFKRLNGRLDFADAYHLSLQEFCEERGLNYPENNRKFILRPASPDEAGLFYSQEEQDAELATVGHMRFDHGSGGNEFWTTWWEHNGNTLNTPEFKAEFQQLVDELRRGPLKDRATMSSYCYSHAGELDAGAGGSHGYVAETENYRYCLRCSPQKGDYSGGLSEKLKVHFDSPEHAINVIRRMLHTSGVILDNASPMVTGTLSQNIRIAALKTPIVDENVGVAASIRIVNPQNMTKADFVNSGTATDEMLDFLAACLRYGISVCVAGATSSGKTTVAGWLLTTIPDNKRIFTIENGSREVELVREKDGQVVNSVVHTLTRDSENERQRITQINLLDIALRFNPDLIFVGEMRGEEANAAQEAARTGVGVLTTIHSSSCEATYRRMVSLCKRAMDMSDSTLMDNVTEAYPLVVFCKQLENKQRRLMEIMECEILPDGTRKYNSIYRYHITKNHYENGNYTIEGYHERDMDISPSLQRRLVDNGMPDTQLQSFLRKEAETA